jgi:multidrug resistance efflux pump
VATITWVEDPRWWSPVGIVWLQAIPADAACAVDLAGAALAADGTVRLAAMVAKATNARAEVWAARRTTAIVTSSGGRVGELPTYS